MGRIKIVSYPISRSKAPTRIQVAMLVVAAFSKVGDTRYPEVKARHLYPRAFGGIEQLCQQDRISDNNGIKFSSGRYSQALRHFYLTSAEKIKTSCT